MEGKNNVFSIIVLIVIVALILYGFVSCCASCSPKDATYHKCMKCDGTGYIRDKYGYFAYVTCPRCNGEGKLYY